MSASRFTAIPFFVVLIGLTGCGKPAEPPTQPQAGHPLPSPFVLRGEVAARGGRLTLLTAGAPRTFNPLLIEDSASEDVVRLLFCGLVSLDAVTQEVRPALAESWSVTPEGRNWTFKLRAGLRWSDGQPLTAADVVFTWNEVMYNPDMNHLSYDLFRINGKNFQVSQTDDLTVRVETPGVFAPFLDFFGTVPVLPQHVIGQLVQERKFLSAFTTKSPPQRVVGSGPFRLKKSVPEVSVLLERNPEYWAMDAQGTRLPYLDEVLLLATSGANPTYFFLEGHGDVCERTRPEEYSAIQEAAKAGKCRLVEQGIGPERDFVWFNLNTNFNSAGQPLVSPAKSAWFRDKRFRQAVSCALDREQIVREAYGGRAKPALTFLGEENPTWFFPDVPHFDHDAARAQMLLADMGIRDRDGDGVLEDASGQHLEFTLISNTGNPAREKTAQLIVAALGRLGMKVQFTPMSFSELVGHINDTCDYECALMGLGGGGVNPASQVNVLRSSEPMHQWFPNQPSPATAWEARIDQLMDLQMRTLDIAARKKLFDEVQLILAEEIPMIYTTAPLHFAALRPDLINVRPAVQSAYRLTWNIEQLALRTR